jgi:translocation and assembly module TamB
MTSKVFPRLALLSCLAVTAVGLPVAGSLAQDTEDYQEMSDEEQKDWLVRLVQDQLSTPERQIRISNIDGILGSDVAIREITISDAEGVWLRVNDARLNWNQAALFLGRLDVRSLTAESIEYLRNAVPVEAAGIDVPAPEASGFAIPEFPVAVTLEELSIPRVVFGESVFGLGSEIALTGALTLEGGNLDADVAIERLDGPGGTLSLDVAYANETETIDLDLLLTEPEDGILANLLNIEGRPAVELSLGGSGPIADLVTEVVLTANGQTVLSGGAVLDQTEAGLGIEADLTGALADLIAPPYRPFFGDQTALTANALVRSEGGLTISGLRLSGGQLSLEAAAETTADNFLRSLTLDAVIADPGGDAVTLPVPGNATRLGAAQVAVDYGADASENWTATVDVTNLTTDGFGADRLSLNLGGVAANLDDAATRRVTLNGDGTISGISASPEIEAALGDSIGLGIAGLWEAGMPIQIAEFRVVGQAIEAALTGTLDAFVFDGTIALDADNISPFSGLAGRDLAGGLTLDATGTLSPLIGGFDLVLDGSGTGLSIDDPVADRLLAGTVSLDGRVARTETGVEADGFVLGNDQISLRADGAFSSSEADFAFGLDLADLSLVADTASGAVSVQGSARGSEGSIDLAFDASVPNGSLADRPLRDATVGFAGQLAEGTLTGDITGSAGLDGYLVELASGLGLGEFGTRLTDLRFETAGTRATGSLLRRPDGLIEGNLALDATDISTAAALALADASGAIAATIDLTIVDDTQSAAVDATVRGLRYNDIVVGAADIAATAEDVFGVPAVDGTISGSDIAASGVEVETLSVAAQQSGSTTQFDGQASLATGTDLDLAGSLAPEGEGYRLGIDRLQLVQGSLSARLASPTVLIVDGSRVVLNSVRFDIGSGSITASGSAGEQLDIALDISSLPLSIANAIVPDLGLAGTISGQASLTGTGADPRATFNLTGSGLNAAAISEFGIAPLTVSAEGRFADGTIGLTRVQANGTGGLQLSGSGTVPLEGGGLNLTVTGSAPLSLANRFVADRGAQVSGVANLNAQVSGSLANPQFSGRVTTAGATYIDPELNLRLNAINASLALTGTEARIEQLSASLATGGSVSGAGTIGLTGQFPANVTLALNGARYADGDLFVATLSGDLTVTGNLLGNPLLSGNVLVERADITVPDAFGSGGELIDVQHINPPPAVSATLERARIDAGGAPIPAGRSPGLLLDVTVNAPNEIFIRGRGLDAEVGGAVRLTGPLDNIQPVGAFELLRGRLSILGQRLDFEVGTVTLVGDLDPQLNFVARTEGDGITVFVNISGRVSDIDVSFTSNPQLPQDEVLARLIFNRSMGELSPLQLARLAGAAAELVGGGGGGGPLDALREAAGFADLDVVTDDQGNVAVQAGTYIQDNVYLGVQAGADGNSKVTINLDVTDELTVKGAAGADGDSSLGIFYEDDY